MAKNIPNLGQETDVQIQKPKELQIRNQRNPYQDTF